MYCLWVNYFVLFAHQSQFYLRLGLGEGCVFVVYAVLETVQTNTITHYVEMIHCSESWTLWRFISRTKHVSVLLPRIIWETGIAAWLAKEVKLDRIESVLVLPFSFTQLSFLIRQAILYVLFTENRKDKAITGSGFYWCGVAYLFCYFGNI